MAENVEFDEEICKVLLDKFQDELASNLKEYYTWNFEPALNKLDESIQKEIRVKNRTVGSNAGRFNSLQNNSIKTKNERCYAKGYNLPK
jgi:hypothetical protein